MIQWFYRDPYNIDGNATQAWRRHYDPSFDKENSEFRGYGCEHAENVEFNVMHIA